MNFKLNIIICIRIIISCLQILFYYNISRRFSCDFAQSTLYHELITFACKIHRNIMVHVSYLQQEQLRLVLRLVSTNMNECPIMLYNEYFLKIFSSNEIPYVYVSSARNGKSRFARSSTTTVKYFCSLNLT